MRNLLFLNIFLLFNLFTLSASYSNDNHHKKESFDAFVERVVVPFNLQPNNQVIKNNQLPSKKNEEIIVNNLKENPILKDKNVLLDSANDGYNNYNFEKIYKPNLKRWKWNNENKE